MRSFLFAPASRRELAERALRSRAHAAILDLEDAVAETEKARAREIAALLLSEAREASSSTQHSRPARLVRVNGADTPFFQDDLALLNRLHLDAVVLPKASVAALGMLPDRVPPVYAIVESARGLREAFELARSPRVAGLMLGIVDLAAELGLRSRSDGAELLFARSQLVCDSAAAGALPPVDGVWTQLDDEQGLAREAALAYTLGLRGKLCIHPAQVDAVNAAFAPDERERDWAQRTLQAYEHALSRGDGATAIDGYLIDRAVAERARRLLGDASKARLGGGRVRGGPA